MKRLSQPTGAVIQQDDAADEESKITRSAILVHAGPNGETVEFSSGDGPIKFDAARIKHVVDVHNLKLERLAKDYGGMDKIPMGAFEPILDSHADDSNDRIIGRLTGPLKFEIRDVPKVGKNVPCAIAEGITFLGKDTVDRIKDGRIYHLSIGINETDDSLGETSTVVQPAAPGAMLLKQGEIKGGSNMSEELKKMQKSERLAKLSAIKESISVLTKKADETKRLMKLTEKKGEITHRLHSLCKSAKMSPAEFRLISEKDKITKLASMSDEHLDLALSIYETRQAPVIDPRQYGSSSSSEVMEMGKAMARQKDQSEWKRLRSEFSKDFKRMTGKPFGKDHEDDYAEHEKKEMSSGPIEERISSVGVDKHAVPGEGGDEKQLAHHLEALRHHLESGDIESAKEAHSALAAHCAKSHMSHHMSAEKESEKHLAEYSGDVKSEDYKSHMTDVQSQLDELKTNMARLAGMVEELMGAEKEEGEHFGEISQEHEAMK